MRRNGLPRSIAAATILITTIVLSGCLEQEEGETDFNGNSDGGGNQSQNAAPTISGSPAAAVTIGDAYSFSPKASDADGDKLTFSIENKPSWAEFNDSTGKLSGQPGLGDVGDYDRIRITVSDGKASSSLSRFGVSVIQVGTVSATLTWTPPTENEDGSPLMDLAGYRIYWGTESGNYTKSVTLDNPGLSSYVVENLVPGTYEFVATSFNESGVESAYSNPTMKVLN